MTPHKRNCFRLARAHRNTHDGGRGGPATTPSSSGGERIGAFRDHLEPLGYAAVKLRFRGPKNRHESVGTVRASNGSDADVPAALEQPFEIVGVRRQDDGSRTIADGRSGDQRIDTVIRLGEIA